MQIYIYIYIYIFFSSFSFHFEVSFLFKKKALQEFVHKSCCFDILEVCNHVRRGLIMLIMILNTFSYSF